MSEISHPSNPSPAFSITPLPATEAPHIVEHQQVNIPSPKWYQNNKFRIGLIIFLSAAILMAIIGLYMSAKTPSSSASSSSYPPSGSSSSSSSLSSTSSSLPPPTPPLTPQMGQGNQKGPNGPYGPLLGDMLSDTQKIFPIGTVVTLYSPYSKGFLRMVDAHEALSKQSASNGGAVVQADGKSGQDPACQWMVKPPYRYQGAVRLDNVAYDTLYLSEAISATTGPEQTITLPGVGVEWSDFIGTTLNFVNRKFSSNTQDVILTGVATALLNDIEHIGAQTHFLVGTNEQGMMMENSTVTPGPTSSWQVKVIGSFDQNDKITYK
jgi:hypothetical protein